MNTNDNEVISLFSCRFFGCFGFHSAKNHIVQIGNNKEFPSKVVFKRVCL